MASNPSTFPQLGMEAMSNGYFMAGNIIGIGSGGGMMGADVTPFHPSMLLEHGSLGFGLGNTAVTVAELGEQFPSNNVVLASFAHQLSATTASARPQDEHLAGPGTPPEDEMDCGFDVGGGDSCSAVSMQCHDQSGGVTIWSSSSKEPYGGWSSGSEPYLVGIPDVAGFHFPLTAFGGGSGGIPSVQPAKSELSLTLCSKSSSDSALNAAEQCSSGPSRSALTELPQASYARAPFAAVVARSRYAAVAQEVLNDVVGRLLDGVADVATDSCSGVDSGARPPVSRSVDASSVVSSNSLMASSEDGGDAGARWGEAPRGRSELLKMLQMLDQKYNQCLDEVQSTTAKFNTLMQHGGVGVGGNAGICAPFAHRAVSAMYRGLRRRIAAAVMAAASRPPTCWGESSSATAGDVERSWESALIQKHWAAQQKPRRGEQPCWRPQRGLPERSVAVLKAWMFEHFLKPYPDDQEKDILAARSGLTRNQVSNWFINARVRIWKPMIEEMYKDLKRSSAGEQGMEMETQQNMSRAICCQLEDGP